MLRSATGTTVVGSVAVWLVGWGWVTGPVTVAVLVTPGAALGPTATVRVMVEVFFFNDPAASEIYTLSLPVALPISVPVPDTKLRPAGRVSVTVRPPDGDGP